MPSGRTVIAIVAVGVFALVAGGVAVFLLSRDSASPATGDLIAHNCIEQHNPWYAICVTKSDGTDERRLTTRLQTSTPAWSPDARHIAFTRNEDVGEYTTFSDDDVFVMDADGDNVRQLTRERDGRHAGRPTWSPDGRQIAYIDGESVPSSQPSRPGGLFVMDANGENGRRLTRGDDTDPAWSPDGRAIAFAHCHYVVSPPSCSLDIYVVNASGGVPRRLTRTAGVFEAAPSWSPDGSRIAFARWTIADLLLDGAAGIYVMNRDGSGERLVLEHKNFTGGLYSLAWSPDGRTLAFETSPNRQCTAISLVDVKSGAVRPLTSCTRRRESTGYPAWQPAVSVPRG
jgi:Tol biopolymer transport system component